MKLLLLISIAHVFDTVLSQNVITTYDGTIGGNKSITECITGNRDPSSDLEITTVIFALTASGVIVLMRHYFSLK